MQRVFLKAPAKVRMKGLFHYKSGLRKFTPACVLDRESKRYCRQDTRGYLKWKARVDLGLDRFGQIIFGV